MKDKKVKFLFVVYTGILIWVILLKLGFSFENLHKIGRTINLIPFHINQSSDIFTYDAVLNFLIFIPFGVVLKMLNVHSEKAIKYGFLFSLCMETIQYIFAIGCADITDVITNTAGTCFGVLLYVWLKKCFHEEKLCSFLCYTGIVLSCIFIILSVAFNLFYR